MDFSKVKTAFPNETISKSSTATTLMNFLDLPADIKQHLLQKFTNFDGKLNAYELSEYVKEMRLKPADWNIKLLEARHTAKGQIKLLTKVLIEFDYAKDQICFSLPEYGFPKKRGEALVDWSIISAHKKQLLLADGAWGEITLVYDCGIVQLDSFTPLCPYTVELKQFQRGRENFTTTEWIDVLLSGLNFNAVNMTETEKLTLLQRFLPFVEKRLNCIELAIKGSGKSYCYSQLSTHNWLTSGTISRATAFYNNATKKVGYFVGHDVVCFDEVQSMTSANPAEMNSMLKGYLENGTISVGEYKGSSDASLVISGNISIGQQNISKHNMFKHIPKMFSESALIDRFALIIEGWNIGRFTEERKYSGWALNASYLTEIFHLLREEFFYRAIIDEVVVAKNGGDARNIEAVKKTCTAYLKLLFPHIKSSKELLNYKEDFIKYCLTPAIAGRNAVLTQLCFIDEEYEKNKMPTFSIVEG